jgi:hypothetical protein
MPDPDLLDDLFLGCAFAAYVQQAQIQQGWPDSEATRRRAYQLYEEALAVNNSGELPKRTRRRSGRHS